MKCIFCGKDEKKIICNDCIQKTTLRDYYERICNYAYNDENVSFYLNNYENNRRKMCLDQIKELIDIYGNADDFNMCRILNFAGAENIIEELTKYVKKHPLNEANTQVLLNMLLNKIMTKDYKATEELCKQIENEEGLFADLYVKCGRFHSMMGDYEIAEEILNSTLTKLLNNSIDTLYKKEEVISNIYEYLRSNDNYKNGKPYKPKSFEMQEELKKIYEKKNIHFLENKVHNIKESEFALLNIANTYIFDNYVVVRVEHVKGIRVEIPYKVSAIKIKNNKTELFEKYIASFDSKMNGEIVIKYLKKDADKFINADSVKDVIKEFVEFIEALPVVSFSILGIDGDVLIRCLRKAGYKELKNEVVELLDFAAEISKDFDGINNTREIILQKIQIKANTEIEKDLKTYIELINLWNLQKIN